MALTSLVTTYVFNALQTYVSGLYSNRNLVNTGATVPESKYQNLGWLKTDDSGRDAGTFHYHDSNWYTKVPWTIGSVIIISTSSATPTGWTEVESVITGLDSSYKTIKFTGDQLLVVDTVAYKKSDQV